MPQPPIVRPGVGSPSASHSHRARFAAQEPAGATLGATLRRPALEGPPKSGRLLIALRAGSGSDWGFSTRLPVARKRPAIHGRPPGGPDPVEALACATGPEGGTRRLFPTVRCHVGSAPLAIGMGKASCGVATRICNAQRIVRCRHALAAACRSHFALRFSWVPVAAFPWPFTLWWLPLGAVVGPARNSVSCVRAGVTRRTVFVAAGRRACCMRRPHRRRKYGYLSDSERCARPHEPQTSEEPVGLTLGAGSVGEGFDWARPVRGPAMDGRPFSRDRSRVENPQSEPDPARRAIDKRPLLGGPSEAGRRSRGPEGETRRLLRRKASRATAMPKASPPQEIRE
jgi:hypothetical protein